MYIKKIKYYFYLLSWLALTQFVQNVHNIAYLKSVENITESSGGTDIESDDSYRQRIFLAPETFSVAGPKLAYVYHTKSVLSDIIDVVLKNKKRILKDKKDECDCV